MEDKKVDLIIRQSYHGSGGSDGYRYRVLDSEYNSLGWVHNFPVFHEQDIFEFFDKLYVSTYEEDDCTPNGEKYEITYIYLKEYKPWVKYISMPVSNTRKNTEKSCGKVIKIK